MSGRDDGFAAVALTGQVAIVTGAAMGMGRATALLMARRGARVIVSDVDDEAGGATVAEIAAAGGEARYVHADVSVERDVEALVAAAAEHFGKLTCAVNNAAIAPDHAPIVECDLDRVDRVLAVNLRGILLCMKHELRHMLAQGQGGAIVNIGSINSARPQPLSAGYNAAKHGVIGLTKTGALEAAPSGIRVNAVLPGAIDTPMIRRAQAESGQSGDLDYTYFTLFDRLGRAEEVAEASAWLCSPAASFVTGHALAVDGGYLAR